MIIWNGRWRKAIAGHSVPVWDWKQSLKNLGRKNFYPSHVMKEMQLAHLIVHLEVQQVDSASLALEQFFSFCDNGANQSFKAHLLFEKASGQGEKQLKSKRISCVLENKVLHGLFGLKGQHILINALGLGFKWGNIILFIFCLVDGCECNTTEVWNPSRILSERGNGWTKLNRNWNKEASTKV